MNTKLATKLQKMVDGDQRAVRRRQQKGVVNARVLKKNTREMKKLAARYGWPTVSLVGKEGSKNAWLIVQHALICGRLLYVVEFQYVRTACARIYNSL